MYLFGIEKFFSTAQSTPACIAQCQREHPWRRIYAPTHAHTLSPTLAAPVLNHNPFRSKEHTVTRVAPVAGPLATAPRRPSCDPTHPTFRPSGSLALRPLFRPSDTEVWVGWTAPQEPALRDAGLVRPDKVVPQRRSLSALAGPTAPGGRRYACFASTFRH